MARGRRGSLVMGTVTGGPETGSAVVDVADMVAFTGSLRTGRLVAVRAAERLIPVGLELAGGDAMVVVSDADIERGSSAAVWGSMFNAGQACIWVERVYVEASRPPHVRGEGRRQGVHPATRDGRGRQLRDRDRRDGDSRAARDRRAPRG